MVVCRRMVLYPNGNTKMGGKDCISLYLAIEETSLPHRWEVNAELKLFVFDKKENNYLALRCIYIAFLFWLLLTNIALVQLFMNCIWNINFADSKDGGIKRFHEMKKSMGFTTFLPLRTFCDKNNGYLSNDSCVFGAEVFVIEPSGKYECLSMVKLKEPDDHATFTWILEKFSTLNEEYYYSKPFTVRGRKWCVIFPHT